MSARDIHKSENGSISITLLNSGLFMKGYYYSEQKPKKLFKSLDELPTDLLPYSTGFKQIDQNWYITIWNPFD